MNHNNHKTTYTSIKSTKYKPTNIKYSWDKS